VCEGHAAAAASRQAERNLSSPAPFNPNTQPPSPPQKQLLALYAAGGLVGATAHVAYSWWDAGGREYGARYAVNAPAFMGCSGGVAAVTAYKFFHAPAAMQMLAIVPIPIAFALFVYCSLWIREEVGGWAWGWVGW
jgi:membrane associated rhomboid family serine protease